MRRRDRRQQKSTPSGPSAPPPHAAAFAAAGIKLICDTCGLADLYPGKRRRVLYLQFLHWRKKTNSMATYQTVLAREARCSVRLVKRTEATGRILGIYAATRWWQDPNRKPVPYDPRRRGRSEPDRWRRRLRSDPLLMRLLTDPTLSGWQRRHLTNHLRLQIIARGIEALTANPGPLLPTLTRITGRVPPLSATHLPRSTWTAALGLDPAPSNTGDPRVPGYPSGTRAVPSGSELPAERLVADDSSAIETPPAPATPPPPPDPSPSTPSVGVLRFAPARGDGDGIPARTAPTSGGPEGEQTARTDRAPDGAEASALADLRTAVDLTRRFWSEYLPAAAAGLARMLDHYRLDRRMMLGVIADASRIAAALRCTYTDAAGLRDLYLEEISDPPQVLKWQQPTDPSP